MPETSPILGLTAPLGSEPVSQGDDHMRANNTILDAALGPYSARWAAESVRADDTLATTSAEIAPALSIAGAPAGLYQAQAIAVFASTDDSYDANYLQLTLDGTVCEYWRVDSSDRYRKTWQLAYAFDFAGGTLQVSSLVRGGAFDIYAGCRLQVFRVSA